MADWRESRIGWKGEADNRRERGIWLILASGGRVRRFVRSKVCVKGLSCWVGSCGVEEMERSGRTVLTRQLYADIEGKIDIESRDIC